MLRLSLILAALSSDPDWIAPFLRGARALEEGAAREALTEFEASDRILPEHPQTDWLAAGAHAQLGELDAAFARLARCVEHGGGEAALLAWDPDLASLREDPRFAALELALEQRTVERVPPFDGVLAPTVSTLISGLGPGAASIVTVGSGKVAILDGRSGEVVSVLHRPGERSSNAAITPDGSWVVVCGQRDGSGGQFARVHDARTGSLVRELGPVGWQARLEFSRDGRRLVADGVSAPDRPTVFETANWTRELSVPFAAEHSSLSPIGDRLLMFVRTSDATSDALLWNVDTRSVVGRVDGVSAISNASIGFSSGGSLAFVVENKGACLRILDGRTGSEVACIQPTGPHVEADAAREDPESPQFRAATFLGASGEIATIDARARIRVWNARSKELLREFQTEKTGRWLKLTATPDGSVIFASGGAGPIHAHDARTGSILWSDLYGIDPSLSPDGELVAYSHWRRPHIVRESRTGRIVLRSDPLALPSTEAVAAPDADAVWIAASDGSLRRVDALTGRTTRAARIGSAPTAHLAISKNGARLAARDTLGVTRVVRADSLAIEAEITSAPSTAHFYDALGPQFSALGDALLVASPVEGLRVFAAKDGALRCTLQAEGARWSHAFAPDGAFLVVAADGGRVHFLDARSGVSLRAPLTIEGAVQTLAFEPDGRRLWVGNDDSTIVVFDVASGDVVRKLDIGDLDWTGTVEVGSIEFRADGRFVTIGSSSWAFVAGYEVEGFRRLWSFEIGGGNGGAIHSAFDASGERILVWGQRRWGTPHIVAASDGRSLFDLKGRYMELLPLSSGERFGAHTGSELDVLRAHDGRVSWTRIEAPEDGWVLATTSGYVDGSRDALERVHLVLEDGSLPLDALAAVLLDPKRVRAAAEGVDLATARRVTIPAIAEIEVDEHSLASPDGKRRSVLLYEASSSDGVGGFEVVVDGRARFEPGDALDGSRRRLTLEVDPADRARTRVRAISRQGVMSRALRSE